MFHPNDILFEDNHLIVVNKRCGDLVQPDPNGDSALENEIKAFIKVRDNKLFDERLLKDNLELYYAMGGCLGPMANEYAFYKTPEHELHAKQTATTGLVNLIGDFLSIAPQRASYTPRQLTEMDKWEKERLEQILGKKISTEAFVCYCTREEYEQQSGLSLKM